MFTDSPNNWLFENYYFSGANSRYWTWQVGLNLLLQTTKDPVVVETGCQRLADDLGAGMSTSIFGEFLTQYGGSLVTVDIDGHNLEVCRSCTEEWSKCIRYVKRDSIQFLKEYDGPAIDFLYLDSLDFPMDDLPDVAARRAQAQNHCLHEFLAAEDKLTDTAILLLDDNQLPEGGKPAILKELLLDRKEWLCLLDLQQSLWWRKQSVR